MYNYYIITYIIYLILFTCTRAHMCAPDSIISYIDCTGKPNKINNHSKQMRLI